MSTQSTKLQQKQQQLKDLEAQVRHLEHQVQQLRRHHGIAISDHALVRFLERTAEVNFDYIKEKLITPQLLNFYKTLGDGTYPIGTGTIKVVIKNATIITVLT